MPTAPPTFRPTTGTAPVHVPKQPEIVRQNDHGEWYSNRRWRWMRMMFLARYPICADPHGDHAREGRCEIATEVHHKIPRLEHPELAYDEDNLEALCKSCHSREVKRT
jgi:5-methylcytosine-specific restriction protein A